MRLKAITFGVFAAAFCSAFGFGNAQLGVRVVDSETGHPISGLRVHGGFLNYSPGWGVAAKDNVDEKTTDQEGFCRLTGNTEAGESCCIVRSNEGFYNSGWYSFNYKERSLLKMGRWLPDDIVVTVRLDRVVSPVPLIVKHAEIPLGKRSESCPLPTQVPISYDLLGCDWLPPYGKGIVPDVMFTLSRAELGREPCIVPGGIVTNEYYRYDVRVQFLGDGNGLIDTLPATTSQLKLRRAPVAGYKSDHVCWRGHLSYGVNKDNYDRDRCCAIRIRTEYDDEGNIKKAYYGKIYGDFRICESREKIVDIDFLYYLSPTPNDRNLEWDRKHNLCPKPGDIGHPQP